MTQGNLSMKILVISYENHNFIPKYYIFVGQPFNIFLVFVYYVFIVFFQAGNSVYSYQNYVDVVQQQQQNQVYLDPQMFTVQQAAQLQQAQQQTTQSAQAQQAPLQATDIQNVSFKKEFQNKCSKNYSEHSPC